MRGRGPVRAVHLNRALSKLGILTRSRATEAILAGRVTVDGRVVRDPGAPIDIERARIAVDGIAAMAAPWRALLVYKPRGVVTTRHDPQGRPTIYDLVGAASQGLVPVGRLDWATSGVLLMTSDTALAGWLTDPGSTVSRVYVLTVRGALTQGDAAVLTHGLVDRGERLRADAVTVRKTSSRESHLVLELREGKNREIRRLLAGVGHEVSRLKRVAFGGLVLGLLKPGEWRDLSRHELRKAFPAAPLLPR